MLRSLYFVAALAATCLGLCCAPAPQRPSTSAAPRAGRIVNGSPASACQFASTVLVSTALGTCTGTLVAPTIVLYASHCGDSVSQILFGSDALKLDAQGNASVDQPTRQVAMAAGSCHLIPGHQPQGLDYAYCKLPEAITDVPIVPILMGCETSVLDQKAPVILVGFGQDGQGSYGKKRYGQATAQRSADNRVAIDGGGAGLCFGDSGGPAFVQLSAGLAPEVAADNSWRVFGIASYIDGTACGGGSVTDLMSAAVPWVEADSGVDITPCTDANGAWSPGRACGNFALDLTDVAGDGVVAACQLKSRQAGPSATCGAAYVAPVPVITIDNPAAGTSPAAGSAGNIQATVTSSADASEVSATLDGQPLSPVAGPTPPAYAFGPVSWGPGDHLLVVAATGAAGGQASAQRSVHVAGDVQPPGGSVPAAAATPSAPAIGDSHAAGCAAAPTEAAGGVGLALILAVARRRHLAGDRRQGHTGTTAG